MNQLIDFSKNFIKKNGKYVLLGLSLLLVGAWGYWSYFSPAAPPGNGDVKVVYEVPRGSGSYRVTADLKKEGLIKNARFFKFYLRLTGNTNSIKQGVYELNDGMSAGEIIEILTSGRVRMMSLRFPEGWNRKQIGDYLTKKKLVANREEFLKITEDPEILRKYKIPGASTEGYLFPSTYSVPVGYSAQKVQDLMIRTFFKEVKKAGAPENISPQDLFDRLTLASIVEREAVKSDERPMMAQVFLNRLKKGMRLESCATIQFLLKKPRFRLYNKDLEIDSPYNTYINRGLPPGPISNPGVAALKASFNPKPGPYLFFVLKPDRSHHFSVSYSEHLSAKKKFLGN